MAVGRDGKVLRNNEPKETKEAHKANIFM